MKRLPLTLQNPATPAQFRDAMSRFATGVTVVTGFDAREKAKVGVTISSFAGVSLKPTLILFCLDEKARALPAFKSRAVFAVHVLAEDQAHLAHIFARGGNRDWKKIPHDKGEGGVPLLKGAMCTFVCRLHKKISGGDHSIIVGKVLAIDVNAKKPRPLLHTQRSYWALGSKKK